MIAPVFGEPPSGVRLARIRRSPNYRDGRFQNPEPTEMLLPGTFIPKLIYLALTKPDSTRPAKPLPSEHTDLSAMDDSTAPVIIWFGHSSYCIKYRGRTILVDPVFSGYASPFSWFGKAFDGTDVYSASDFTTIDLLVITHDHYDHLDYHTVRKLGSKVDRVVTSPGVGSHLEAWGIPAAKISEPDWWESCLLSEDWEITATPARHFSGRTLNRNQTHWSSFVLEMGGMKLFLGGDSGYGCHFKDIGERFGPFNLAILEAGQYNMHWPFIHMFPEEALPACRDLRAEAILPVHWAKFALAYHPWHEPVERILATFAGSGIHVVTPKIGQPFHVGEKYPTGHWWNLM